MIDGKDISRLFKIVMGKLKDEDIDTQMKVNILDAVHGFLMNLNQAVGRSTEKDS